jgi:hypothetical protein
MIRMNSYAASNDVMMYRKLLIEGETNWKKNKYSVKELYQHKDGVRCVRLTPERLYRLTVVHYLLLLTQQKQRE